LSRRLFLAKERYGYGKKLFLISILLKISIYLQMDGHKFL